MSLFISSLNSGSNGNCYFIGNEKDSVLIDAGISCRETERRMIRLGLALRNVRAIFITHEHTDHIKGADVLSKKYRLPVYVTAATYKHSRMKIEPPLLNFLRPGIPVTIGHLEVHPIPKMHDAADPHSFTVTSGDVTAGVFTDIGMACDHVSDHIGRCNAAFLEANYDERMLAEGRYPVYLKNRIRGMEGHLSNDQALDLFLTRRSAKLELLILSHLSAENNRPEIVQDLFKRHANGTRIEVASRYRESEIFTVG